MCLNSVRCGINTLKVHKVTEKALETFQKKVMNGLCESPEWIRAKSKVLNIQRIYMNAAAICSKTGSK